MKKHLILLISSLFLISPIMSGCGTIKPSVGPENNEDSEGNKDPNDGNNEDSEGNKDPNDGNETLGDSYNFTFDYSFMSEGYDITDNEIKGIKSESQIIESASSYACYRTDSGQLKFSSKTKLGTYTINFKKELTFKGLTLDLEAFGTDKANLKVIVGEHETILQGIKNQKYFIEIPDVKASSLKIEALNKRFILNSLTINKKESGDSSDGGVIIKPAEPKPATLSLTYSGDGSIKPSRSTGMSGDKVTFEITMPENTYLRLTNNGKRVGKENGIYTLTLVPGENKVNAEFVKFVPGKGHPELFESVEAQNWGDRGDSKIPLEEYYEPVRGLKGEELKDALYELIQPTNRYSYDDLKESFEFTEIDPDSPSNMVLMYSGEYYPISLYNGKLGSGRGALNREHVWPNSRGVGTSGPGSDKHMQRICEAELNGRRSHYDFGYVSDGEDLSSLREVNKGNILGDERFEPKDAFKGDTARIIFYMATCYSELELDRPTDTTNYNFWSATNMHGDFDDLYEWATDPTIDPVSKFEMNRNNVVDTCYQHNRNPFIDHPEFIEMIYDKNYSGAGALND